MLRFTTCSISQSILNTMVVVLFAAVPHRAFPSSTNTHRLYQQISHWEFFFTIAMMSFQISLKKLNWKINIDVWVPVQLRLLLYNPLERKSPCSALTVMQYMRVGVQSLRSSTLLKPLWYIILKPPKGAGSSEFLVRSKARCCIFVSAEEHDDRIIPITNCNVKGCVWDVSAQTWNNYDSNGTTRGCPVC